jgi:hypothetical protein
MLKATRKVRMQLGIGELQKRREPRDIRAAEVAAWILEKSLEQRIELAHAAAAAPAQPAGIDRGARPRQ